MRAPLFLLFCSLLSWGAATAAAQASTCQTDLGKQGPGNGQLSVCGQKLLLGQSATLSFTGGPPNGSADLILGSASDPIATSGGTLVPIPETVVPIQLDENGAYAMTIPGGALCAGGTARMLRSVPQMPQASICTRTSSAASICGASRSTYSSTPLPRKMGTYS